MTTEGKMEELDIPNSLLEKIRNEAIEEYAESMTEEIQAQIDYVITSEDPPTWTAEYKAGYLDGLEQAMNHIGDPTT